MNRLEVFTVIAGGIMLIDSFFLMALPSCTRKFLVAFPRNRWVGWVLTAVSLGCATWLLWCMPLGRFDSLKPALVLVAPVTYALILICMDELLAARALGTVLILVPAPILEAARFHPSPWRLVMVVLAYIMAVKGLALILSPYLLRKSANYFLKTDTACRSLGVVGVAIGVLLLVLGIQVY